MEKLNKYKKLISLSFMLAICAINAGRSRCVNLEQPECLPKVQPTWVPKGVASGSSSSATDVANGFGFAPAPRGTGPAGPGLSQAEVDAKTEFVSKLCEKIADLVYIERCGQVKIGKIIEYLLGKMRETDSNSADAATDFNKKLTELVKTVAPRNFLRTLITEDYSFCSHHGHLSGIVDKLSASLSMIAAQIDLIRTSITNSATEDMLIQSLLDKARLEAKPAEWLALAAKILDKFDPCEFQKLAKQEVVDRVEGLIEQAERGRYVDAAPDEGNWIPVSGFEHVGSKKGGPSLQDKITGFLKQLLEKLPEAAKEALGLPAGEVKDEIVGLGVFLALSKLAKLSGPSTVQLGPVVHMLFQVMEEHKKDITSAVAEIKRYIQSFVNAVRDTWPSGPLYDAAKICGHRLEYKFHVRLKADEITYVLEKIEEKMLHWKKVIVIGKETTTENIERMCMASCLARIAPTYGIELPKPTIIICDVNGEDAISIRDGTISVREGHAEVKLPETPNTNFFKSTGWTPVGCLAALTGVAISDLLKALNKDSTGIDHAVSVQTPQAGDHVNHQEPQTARDDSIGSEGQMPLGPRFKPISAQPAEHSGTQRRGRWGGPKGNATSSDVGTATSP